MPAPDGRTTYPVHEVVASPTTAALADQYACLKAGRPRPPPSPGVPQKDLVQLTAAVKTTSTGKAVDARSTNSNFTTAQFSVMGGSTDTWAEEKAALTARTAAFVEFVVFYPSAAPRSPFLPRSPVSIRACEDGSPTILVYISKTGRTWDRFFNDWLSAPPQGTRK